MNLRNWSMDHTKGVIMGILVPLLCVPIVIFVLGMIQGYSFTDLWHRFTFLYQVRVQILTISVIANLGIFYLFLNKERYNVAMGIILGSLIYAPYIIYIKFF